MQVLARSRVDGLDVDGIGRVTAVRYTELDSKASRTLDGLDAVVLAVGARGRRARARTCSQEQRLFRLRRPETAPPLARSAAPASLEWAITPPAPKHAALRCIDGSHGAGCTLCAPPPEEGDDAQYELAGEYGKKNGEKRCVLARARVRRVHCRSGRSAQPLFGAHTCELASVPARLCAARAARAWPLRLPAQPHHAARCVWRR